MPTTSKRPPAEQVPLEKIHSEYTPAGMTADSLSQAARPQAEMELLRQAAGGDALAVQRVLNYLGAADANLRQIMLAALHAVGESRVWSGLLGCLALGKWQDVQGLLPAGEPSTASSLVQNEMPGRPGEIVGHPSEVLGHTSDLLGHTIAQAFVIDESAAEAALKESLLEDVLQPGGAAGQVDAAHLDYHSQHWRVRQAAAYLTALRLAGGAGGRGAHTAARFSLALAVLNEVIAHGELAWRLRAVEALAALGDEHCAQPLVQALVWGLEERLTDLHQAAGRALGELGGKAALAWEAALHHPDSHIRWHAARGLSEAGRAGDLGAVHILAEGLYDENQAVRWTTARVLANLEGLAIPAILDVLTLHPLDEQFRQAVYHALHAMSSRQMQTYLRPLLDALDGRVAQIEAPLAAQKLKKEWRS